MKTIINFLILLTVTFLLTNCASTSGVIDPQSALMSDHVSQPDNSKPFEWGMAELRTGIVPK